MGLRSAAIGLSALLAFILIEAGIAVTIVVVAFRLIAGIDWPTVASEE